MRKSYRYSKTICICIINTVLFILGSFTSLFASVGLLSFSLSIILLMIFDFRFIDLIISLIEAFLFALLIYAIKDYKGFYGVALGATTPIIIVSESIGFIILKIIKSNRTKSIQKEKEIEAINKQ